MINLNLYVIDLIKFNLGNCDKKNLVDIFCINQIKNRDI